MNKKVIYDTDPGIDDAMALLYLNACEQLELIGVTTIMGNASIDQCTTNALFLCERFDIDAGVFKGAGESLSGAVPETYPAFVHGANGLGDIDYIEHTRMAASQSAAEFIVETVTSSPNEISIIAVGRLTNVARALETQPGISALIKEIIVMGGAYQCEGNVSPFAEANINGDPEAAARVFREDIPITMVGLDVTMQTRMSSGYLKTLCDDCGATGEFIWDITRAYAGFYKEQRGLDNFPVHDSSAVAFADRPDLFETVTGRLDCILDGEERGRTIVSPNDQGPHRVCISVDSDGLLSRYRDTMTRHYSMH